MAHSQDAEFFILTHIHERGACTIDQLCDALSPLTTNQILLAIDRLSRAGTIVLEHPDRFEYLISPKHVRSAVKLGMRDGAA